MNMLQDSSPQELLSYDDPEEWIRAAEASFTYQDTVYPPSAHAAFSSEVLSDYQWRMLMDAHLNPVNKNVFMLSNEELSLMLLFIHWDLHPELLDLSSP